MLWNGLGTPGLMLEGRLWSTRPSKSTTCSFRQEKPDVLAVCAGWAAAAAPILRKESGIVALPFSKTVLKAWATGRRMHDRPLFVQIRGFRPRFATLGLMKSKNNSWRIVV